MNRRLVRHFIPVICSLMFLFVMACSSKKNSGLTAGTTETDTTPSDGTIQDPYDPSTSAVYASLSGSLFDSAQVSTTPAATSTVTATTTCVAGQVATASGCVSATNLWGDSEDDMLDFMAGSFGEMNFCYQAVLNRGKEVFTGSGTGGAALPQEQNAVVFEQAANALVRCYSQVLENQKSANIWRQEQDKAYQAQQQNMQLFLYLINSLQK